MVLPVPQEVQNGFLVAVTAVVTRWLTLRGEDRKDERATLLAAFQGMQAAFLASQAQVLELQGKMHVLEGHVQQANDLAIAAASENAVLRRALIGHGIACPEHGEVPQ